MTNAFYFNPNCFRVINLSDVERWLTLYKIINTGVCFLDRTGHIKLPVKTSSPQHLMLPNYNNNFTLSYEDCCQLQVKTLLKTQEQLDVPIRILYSGGIDSSLIVSSFIKELGMVQTEKRVQLVMSVDSIEENPCMWNKILRKSNIRILPGEDHVHDWNCERILVGGEFNDQLMGSDVYSSLVRWKGDSILDTPWNDTIITEYLLHKGLDAENAEFFTNLFVEHLHQAPCSVESVADWWWWINFSCKWHSVYFRLLSQVDNHKIIDAQYLQTYYCQFYGSEEFQLWSMKDRVHKHKGTWFSYKWHPRELVCKFMNDNSYAFKMKRSSLQNLLRYRPSADIIDDDYCYHYNIDALDWYTTNNSFLSNIKDQLSMNAKQRFNKLVSTNNITKNPQIAEDIKAQDDYNFFKWEKFPCIGSAVDKQGDRVDFYQSQSLSFCPATGLFLKTLGDLWERGLSNPYISFGNKSQIIWAQKDTEIVGGIVYDYNDEAKVGWIILGFVATNQRRKGIYTALHNVFEDEIKKIGGLRIGTQLHVDSTNQVSTAEALGLENFFYRTQKWTDTV
jgi:hypothetical protein